MELSDLWPVGKGFCRSGVFADVKPKGAVPSPEFEGLPVCGFAAEFETVKARRRNSVAPGNGATAACGVLGRRGLSESDGL